MELKQVIHFYVGCWVIYPGMVNKRKLTGPWLYSLLEKGIDVKLILRHLSSITDDEKKEIFEIIFKRKFPDSGRIIWFEEKTRTVDSRWCLWSGVDRAVIEMDGTVWADCDLNYRKFNSHLISAYLLSRGFDLFNLIESGQAIDATTLTQQK